MRLEELKRGKITLLSFTKLKEDTLLQILAWRNHERIRAQMRTTDIITLDDHLAFCKRLKDDLDVHYWLVERKEKSCGVVYLHSMERNFETSEWGYYASPQFLGTGIGLEMAFEAIKIFFETIGVKSLHGYIKETNIENRRIQKIIGFKEIGVVKKHGVKLIDTVLEEKIPEEEFKHFQKRLLHEKQGKSHFD